MLHEPKEKSKEETRKSVTKTPIKMHMIGGHLGR